MKEMMKNKKIGKMLLFTVGIFLLQIVMLFLCRGSTDIEFTVKPLVYLYGYSIHTKEKVQLIYVDMWMLNSIMYCLFVITGETSQSREGLFFLLPRYKKYRYFYQKIAGRFLLDTVLYQVAVAAGAVCGIACLKVLSYSVVFEKDLFLAEQVCMLFGNLMFGSIALYVVMRVFSLKTSLIIYPGIPIACYIAGIFLPTKIANFLPGSWLLVCRSSMELKKGYSLPVVFAIELLVTVVVLIKLLRISEVPANFLPE